MTGALLCSDNDTRVKLIEVTSNQAQVGKTQEVGLESGSRGDSNNLTEKILGARNAENTKYIETQQQRDTADQENTLFR